MQKGSGCAGEAPKVGRLPCKEEWAGSIPATSSGKILSSTKTTTDMGQLSSKGKGDVSELRVLAKLAELGVNIYIYLTVRIVSLI